MSGPGATAAEGESAGPKLWTGRFAYTLVTVFGVFFGYQTLLVILPLEIADQGGSNAMVGLGTALFMLTAVLAQLSTPRLLARYNIRPLLLWALLLLGIPSFLQPMTESASVTLGLNLVRGTGIGIGSVAGATAVSLLAPPTRRGEALGLFGLMTAVPSAVGSIVALTLLQETSFAVVFVALGIFTLSAGAATLPIGPLAAPRGWERDRRGRPPTGDAAPVPELRHGDRRLRGHLDLRVLVPDRKPAGAAIGVLLRCRHYFRRLSLLRGVIVDRIGASRVLLVGLFCGAASMLLLGWAPSYGVALAAGALFGSSLGAVATSTHFRLLSRAKEHETGEANTLFNVAFNAGIGAGGLIFGGVASVLGYASAFLAAGLWIMLAMTVYFADKESP